MNTALRYSIFRILIFIACLLVLWLAGIDNPLILLLAAATLSMLISVFALNRMRDRMSVEVAEHVARRRTEKTGRAPRRESDEDVEDSLQDSRRSGERVSVDNPDGYR